MSRFPPFYLVLLPLCAQAQYVSECGETFNLSSLDTGETVNIYSHKKYGMGLPYPTRNYRCTHKIEKGPTCEKWSFHCPDFMTNGYPRERNGKWKCKRGGDKVTVVRIKNKRRRKLGTFCGTQPPTTIQNEGAQTLLVSFQVRNMRPMKGFKCIVKCTKGSRNPAKVPPSEPSAACYCGLPQRVRRIVGGKETEVNEYPWQVGLVYSQSSNSLPFCGGTLISDRHVITAAHCLDFFQNSSQFNVLLGEHDLTTNDETTHLEVGVDSFGLHPDYNKRTVDNDYGWIKLATAVDFGNASNSHIRPACLPTKSAEQLVGQTCIITGWGSTSFQGNQSKVLLETTQKIMNNSACNNTYNGLIKDSMFCATSTYQDSCQGDSGGPFVCRKDTVSFDVYELQGITSWGIGCGTNPGVYAKVYEMLDSFYDSITNGTMCVSPD